MKNWIKATLGVTAAVGLTASLSACAVEDATLAVPQSFCGFIQGKGGRDSNNNANDAELKQVLYQGQSADFKKDQRIGKVFPCVTRNYVVSPEGLSGDSHIPLNGITKDGTPVFIWVTAYWQPNQAAAPIRDFIGFCQGKYGCAADSPVEFTGSGTQNVSTPGWNKMLAENMWPTLQRVVEAPVHLANDEVWKVNDPAQRESIQNEMSDRFAETFQKTTGSVNDLLCGSGSTGSGETFNCEPVRIVVDAVTAQSPQAQQTAGQAAAADAQRKIDQDQLEADKALTNAKYGPLAEAYRACRDLNKVAAGTCRFVVGPGGNVQIQTP